MYIIVCECVGYFKYILYFLEEFTLVYVLSQDAEI